MEQNLIEEYNDKSRIRIDNDNSVSEHKETLEDCRMNLVDLKLNGNIFTVLRHPIRTVRTNYYLQRLSKIEKEFYSLLDSDLLEFLDNDLPITEESLTQAYRFYKPLKIRKFMQKNSEQLRKMLIR